MMENLLLVERARKNHCFYSEKHTSRSPGSTPELPRKHLGYIPATSWPGRGVWLREQFLHRTRREGDRGGPPILQYLDWEYGPRVPL